MTPLELHARDFINDAKTRNLSPGTLRFYEPALRALLAFAATRDLEHPEDLTPAFLRAYVAEGMSGLNPGGIAARLRAARAFLGFLVREEVLDRNPFTRFRMPRVPDVAVPVVSLEDVHTLLATAARGRHPLRDQAVVALLFDTGLRASELCGIKLDDLRIEHGAILVHGKGGKDRLVPISRAVLKRLRKYVREERPRGHLEALFLLSAHASLNVEALRHMLNRHFREAGLEEKGCHAFRRGFAVAYHRNGGDVFTLQRIMGHTTLTMSNRYARMNFDSIKEAHVRASPASRI